MLGVASGLSDLSYERAQNIFSFFAKTILHMGSALVSFKVNFYTFDLLAQVKRRFGEKAIKRGATSVILSGSEGSGGGQ